MDVNDFLINWAKRRKPTILSDGDWDGIVASTLLLKIFEKYSIHGVKVWFPSPAKMPSLKVSNKILIELPPSRGYEITGECILIDHHGFTGVKMLKPDSMEIIYEYKEPISSVAELVVKIFGLELGEEWSKLVEAVRLIDKGESFANRDAEILHKAYLYNVSEQGFRNYLLRILLKDDWNALWKWAEEGYEKYEKAREVIKDITRRAIEYPSLTFTWFNVSNRQEKIVFREAMIMLEKNSRLVVVAATEKDRVLRLHLGTKNPSVDASKEVIKLAKLFQSHGFKVTYGGKKEAAGIQFSEKKPGLGEVREILLEY